MKKLLKDTKGAVTVFVTLLLIPAMLISGTAVDLARIHTAKGIVQNASELAANATLTQYNSLLYDLYAIFGIAQDDPILGKLLDEYIKVSVFGEAKADKGMGTLQLFYGSDLSLEEPFFPDGKNLKNPDVLRRQIEEYMKFRGPVIIVKEFLELLGMSTFKSDSGVISDKLDIEEAIAGIFEKYKQLYDTIQIADKCNQVNGGVAGRSVGTVSSSLELILHQFVALDANFEAWLEAEDEDKSELVRKHDAILRNIISRTVGGSVGNSWSNGGWQHFTNPQGLETTITNAKENVNSFKPRFHDVITIAREVDGLKTQLSRMIDSLENKLNSENVNEELKAALTRREGSPPRSIIERYRDMLKWGSIESMAVTFKDGGYHYLDNILKPYLDDVVFRSERNAWDPRFTRFELANAFSLSNLSLSESNSHTLYTLANYTREDISYGMPSGFLKFGEHPGHNQEFFKELESFLKQPEVNLTKLYDGQNESSGSDSAKKQENMIKQLGDLVKTAYAGLKNDPLGAKQINSATSSAGAEVMDDFGSMVKQANNSPVSNIISDPSGSIGRAGDYLLLLTYCNSMFSNYTTGRPEITGKRITELDTSELPKTMAKIPLSPRVNYFFQSEMEYLYNGSETAGANLSAVTRLIFMVRLICNYITVFSVREVNTVVNGIRTAFAWNPPLGLLLGELARAAFVAAESAIDVAKLRGGGNVPLLKSVQKGEWVCRPSSIVSALNNVAFGTKKEEKKNDGLSYTNYMTFFFITKAVTDAQAGDELVKRTANLIEWNMINYMNNINSDESKMKDALAQNGRFKLENMKTDFSLTTKVEMRMLFLSMIFAQNFSGSRGIGMPTQMPLEVTVYRGY